MKVDRWLKKNGLWSSMLIIFGIAAIQLRTDGCVDFVEAGPVCGLMAKVVVLLIGLLAILSIVVTFGFTKRIKK